MLLILRRKSTGVTNISQNQDYYRPSFLGQKIAPSGLPFPDSRSYLFVLGESLLSTRYLQVPFLKQKHLQVQAPVDKIVVARLHIIINTVFYDLSLPRFCTPKSNLVMVAALRRNV